MRIAKIGEKKFCMKQFVFAAIFLVSIVSLVSINSVYVSAQVTETFEVNINLAGSTENLLSTCPTITKDEVPLTSDDIEIFVENLDSRPDTFDLKLELPSEWSGFPDDFGKLDGHVITLAPGEKGKFPILFVTVPDVEPGIYKLKAHIKSMNTEVVVTKEFQIEVLKCHSVEINIVSKGAPSTCSEKPEKITYALAIKNGGRSEETVSLRASIGTEPVSWVSFSSDSFSIKPGESKKVELILEPPANLIGKQEIRISAVSETSYARDSKEVFLELQNCFDYSTEFEPDSATACLGRTAEYSLTITNTGEKKDKFEITSADFVELSENSFELEPGETKTIIVSAKTVKEGTQTFDVIITPANDPSNKQKITASLESRECSGVAVVTTTPEITACRGEEVKVSVMIKNTGTLEDRFRVSSNLGTINKEEITLQPQEIKMIELILDTREVGEEDKIVIKAESDKISDKAEIQLALENCYDANFSMLPASQDVCPRTDVEYTLIIENTGTRDDSYTLIFGDKKINIDIAPGDSREFKFIQTIMTEEPGEYRVTAALISDHIEKVAESKLNIRPFGECFSVSLEGPEKGVTIQPNKAVTIPVEIKNTGKSPASFIITFEGPPWAFVTPQSLELQPEEAKSVYIYVSPQFDTPEGEYKASLKAKSKFVESEANFSIFIGETPAEGEEKEVIIIDTGEKGPTISFPNIKEITGAILSGKASIRLIIVGIIALLIIAILVIRFIMLFR